MTSHEHGPAASAAPRVTGRWVSGWTEASADC